MKNKILTFVFGALVFFFIISLAIALPIYFRPFYYAHINGLNLPGSTGYDYATIKTAFDEVMNYLTLPNTEFKCGTLHMTPSGIAHFEDCKILFTINSLALIISSLSIITLAVLEKKNIIKLLRPFDMHVSCISAMVVMGAFVLLAIIIAIDFNGAFTVFHHIFFPGKTNWSFDPRYDQIINILPQQLFFNSALLIIGAIVVLSVTIIVFQLIKKKKAVQ